jgi:hypothetical protein
MERWDKWPVQGNGLPQPARDEPLTKGGMTVPVRLCPELLGDRWLSGEVFIVGGGPSLIGFDFEQLRGRNVLAINAAYVDLPWADMVYFCDEKFWVWNRDDPKWDAHPGLKLTFSARAALMDKTIERVDIDGVSGWADREDTIRSGKNSGYQAIQIAVKCGASRLILLGFDHAVVGGRTHYHDRHRDGTPNRAYDNWHPHWQTIVEHLTFLGVEVFNANPESTIDAFPKHRLETLL